MRRTITTAALMTLLALATAACPDDGQTGQGTRSATPTSASPTAEPTFTGEALATVILQPSEAMQGTTPIADLTGPQSRTDAASDEEDAAKLEELEMESGYEAVFASAGVSEANSVEEIPEGALYVVAEAQVFPSPENASAMFAFYRDTWLPKNLTGTAEVSATGLGTESYGARFETLSGVALPGIGYMWRSGNGLFFLTAARKGGGIQESDVRAMADAMSARTKTGA